MAYLFDDEVITCVADLLNWLERDDKRLHKKLNRTQASKPAVWFRGLRRIKRPLVPTFHRDNCKIEDEVYLMNLFKQNSVELLSQVPDNEWEWMFIMRHHNLPSRMLDWTERILWLAFTSRFALIIRMRVMPLLKPPEFFGAFYQIGLIRGLSVGLRMMTRFQCLATMNPNILEVRTK